MQHPQSLTKQQTPDLAGPGRPAGTAAVLRTSLGALLGIAALAAATAGVADEPVCGPEVKAVIAEELAATEGMSAKAKLDIEAKLYETFSYCAEGSDKAIKALEQSAKHCGARVGYAGSLYYEDMTCCGYDPQRRTFGCPVRIKQPFGFGPAPLPGSREYVLNCVADDSGVLRPVGDDSVHLADSVDKPSWQFAVIANADDNLQLTQPMDGSTRRARSILSWGLEPTGCDYQPIWGNWLDYRIRLDQ